MHKKIATIKSALVLMAMTVFILCTLLSGCTKFMEIDPQVTSIDVNNIYENEATAISAVTGLYAELESTTRGDGFSNPFSGALLACSADELRLITGVTNVNALAYYRNELVANVTQNIGDMMWRRCYNLIYDANLAMQGLSKSPLREIVKVQLTAEAKFVRAFCYFYLVNCYGDAVLALNTEPATTLAKGRSSKDSVYKQIIADLQDAQRNLSPSYLNGELTAYSTGEARVRPNAGAASALLARTYLYTGDYANAETESTKLIENKAVYDTVPLNQVFLKNSKEAIWQLQPIAANRNTNDGFFFILAAGGPNASNPCYLSNALLNAFEAGDNRGMPGNWVNSVTTGGLTYYFPFKYKQKAQQPVTEYDMVLRLGEQYLIRAEARAQLNKLTGQNSAAADLDLIRYRAGLPQTTATTKEEMLAAIMKERRVELFTEWGHRWLDIKRSGTVDNVMAEAAIEKGSTWRSYQQWYPLPFIDIQNSNVLQQNAGY